MLVYLNKPNAVSAYVPLLQAAKTQEDLLFYGMTLRVAAEGWTNQSQNLFITHE